LDQRIDRSEMAKVIEFLGNSFRKNTEVSMKGVKSSTQVDGGDELDTVQDKTKTGLDLSNVTYSSGEVEDGDHGSGGIKATEADGGDTSQYVDVHNTGDDGDLEADVQAGEEFNDSGYSFDSKKIVALELPIEKEDETQVLELKEIGSGVYVLKQSYTSPGSGRLSFTKGIDASKVLRRGTKPGSLKASVDRLITLKGSQNALLIRSSAVLGVIAIEAPFQKGLKNARYSVFSRTGMNLVNEDGYYIRSAKGARRVIASAVSNRSVQRGAEKANVFGDVESAFVQYLQSSMRSLVKSNADLKVRLDKALLSGKRRKVLQSQLLNSERDSSRKQVASALQNLNAIRTGTASAEGQRALAGTQSALREEAELRKSQADRNISYLANMM
jgi:hypothetical protein